jgi:hypothetical protein
MNGLLRRLRSRSAAPADEIPPESPAASEPVDGTVTQPIAGAGDSGLPGPGGPGGPARSAEEQAALDERLRRARDLPAGVDLAELERARDGSGRRGRVRHRVRYLRRVRELLLRDLGGFFYEVHRTAGGHQHGGHREILEGKAARLAAVDGELRQLEGALGESRDAATTVVREPGVGGTCPHCGELHGSDARFCARCGAPLSERGRRDRAAEVDRTIAAREAEAAAREAEAAERARAAAAPPAAPDPSPAADAPTSELNGANGADRDRVASERTS